jgi:hypothetical protein
MIWCGISPLALDLFIKYPEDRRITSVYDINIVELVFLKAPAFFTCYKTLHYSSDKGSQVEFGSTFLVTPFYIQLRLKINLDLG